MVETLLCFVVLDLGRLGVVDVVGLVPAHGTAAVELIEEATAEDALLHHYFLAVFGLNPVA